MGMKNASMGKMNGGAGGPTLPPHPKQKQLPVQTFPGQMSMPPGRMDSLRGISALSRGISSLSRGLSTESQGGINSFEDKFFSMLMNGDNKQFGGNIPTTFNPTPMSGNNGSSNNAAMNNNSNSNSNSNKGSQSNVDATQSTSI